jgi:hypothetical protein
MKGESLVVVVVASGIGEGSEGCVDSSLAELRVSSRRKSPIVKDAYYALRSSRSK